MHKNRWMSVAAALVVGGGAAAALGVLPAVGQSSPPSNAIIVGSTAKIIDRGVAAKPYAYVVCPPGSTISQLSFKLTERSGKFIASGSGYTDINCTGEIETVTVPVTARAHPFVSGKGFAEAEFFYCGNYGGCTGNTANRTITFSTK
jgi:hypothetical protein